VRSHKPSGHQIQRPTCLGLVPIEDPDEYPPALGARGREVSLALGQAETLVAGPTARGRDPDRVLMPRSMPTSGCVRDRFSHRERTDPDTAHRLSRDDHDVQPASTQ
jgi:hypothetical protein